MMAHTEENEEDLQFLKSHMPFEVIGEIEYCYGRTNPIKAKCQSFNEWSNLTQQFSKLIFAMSREDVLTKQNQGYICFPPEYCDVLSKEVRQTLKLLSNELTGVVICNYNTTTNLSMFNCDIPKELKKLKVKVIPDHNNRILWFHPDGIIINVRITSKDNVTAIEKELINSRDDLKLFYLMNNSILRATGICITSLLVALDASEETIQEVCEPCVNNIVNATKIQNKCVSLFLDNTRQKKRKAGITSTFRNITITFKDIISQIVASMAGSKSDSQGFLPVLGGSPEDKLASLMLNPKQLAVLRSQSKIKIVKGVYGGGKSIVGRVLFEYHAAIYEYQLINNVYYIVWDRWSLLSLMVKDLEETFRTKVRSNIKVMGKIQLLEMLEIEDVDASLQTVLHALETYHDGESVYTVIDEFQPVDEEELHSLLKEKNISATVLVQPMRTHCVGDNKVSADNTDGYDDKIFYLTETMRTTESVSNVLKISQNVLEQEPTIYYKKGATLKSEMPEDTNANESFSVDPPTGPVNENLITANAKRGQQSVRSIPLIDCIQRPSQNHEFYGKVALECSYQKFEHLGHKICEFKLPIYFEWPVWPYNEKELSRRSDINVAVNLNKIFKSLHKNAPGKKVTVLCNIATKKIVIKSLSILSEEKHQVIFALSKNKIIEYMPFIDKPGVYPSEKYKEETYKKFKNINDHVMVTDIRGFRGLDTPNLIVVIDRNEHQGRQLVAEIIARCTTNRLFILPANNITDTQSNKQTLQDLVNAWKRNKIVHVKQLDVCEKELSVWKKIALHREEGNVETELDLSYLISWNKYVKSLF